MRKKLAISNPLSSHGIFRELLDILLFMIITYGLHYLWWNFLWDYKEVLYINEAAGILAQGVFHCASFILDIVGVAHRAIDNTLYFDNSSIKVTITCSGLKQMYQIFFLLLLFPGRFVTKSWFIPAGMVFLFWLNILRIVLLSFVIIIYPAIWDFSHDWILRPFFYVVIFVIWLIWLKYFSGRNATETTDGKKHK